MSERKITQGTILHDRYVIQETLGEGGFGITYRAIECDSGKNVAIKEYFPLQLASRQSDSSKVLVSKQQEAEYLHGKERFLKEASILKEYQYLKGIVKVWDCFETNNTAYIIMEYIDGITLKEYVASHETIEYWEFMDMLTPVLKSLIALHKHGVIHRDISPDNLMIGMDNSLYLIDFGAAKEMEYGKTTTILLKAGYAPPEQYLHDGDMGAWTDVYGICATIYTALSGKVPTDAVARLQKQELIPLSEYGVKLETWQQDAILKGMRMRAAKRFRDVEQLYDALTIEPSYEEIKTIGAKEMEPEVRKKLKEMDREKSDNKTRNKKWVLGLVLLALFLVVIGGMKLYNQGYFARWQQIEKQNEQAEPTAQVKKLISTEEPKTEEVKTDVEENLSTKEPQVKLCTMPNVVGRKEKKAKNMIAKEDAVIAVHVTRVHSNDVAADVVIEQSVKSETQYNEGALKEVVLTVSDGPKPVTNTPAAEKNKKAVEDDYFDIEVEGDKMEEFYLD